MKKIKLGISSCLTGAAVRYDGGHKMDSCLTEALKIHLELVPVCPEVEYGLPVPREPLRLIEVSGGLRIVTIFSKIDHTEGMKIWAEQKLNELKNQELCGFIFKSGSPNSGLSGVRVYDSSGRTVRTGSGIFAGAFIDRFPLMPVADEEHLQNPALLQEFIRRALVFSF